MAGGPLVRAFFLDASQRISNRYCRGHRSDNIGAKAVIVSTALRNINGCLVFLAGNTEGPAGNVVSTLILTILKSRLAFGVLCTDSPLIRAFRFDTVKRSSDSYCRWHLRGCLIQAAVLLGALGDIDSSLRSLASKTESPAGSASSTFLLAGLKCRKALGVLLALGVLVGAFFLDASNRVSDSYCR